MSAKHPPLPVRQSAAALPPTKTSSSRTRSPWRQDPVAALLDLAGPVDGRHVLVIGGEALEILCRLNERGALSVTTARAGHWLPCGPVDLVIVPRLDSLDLAERAIAQTSCLAASLLLRFGPDAPPALLTAVQHGLRQRGFGVARLDLAGRIAIRAERHHS